MNLNTLLFPPRIRKFFFYSRFQECSRFCPTFPVSTHPLVPWFIARNKILYIQPVHPRPCHHPSPYALRGSLHEWSELACSCIRAVGCQQRPGSAVFPRIRQLEGQFRECIPWSMNLNPMRSSVSNSLAGTVHGLSCLEFLPLPGGARG